MTDRPARGFPGGPRVTGTRKGVGGSGQGVAVAAGSGGKGFLLDLERCVGCGACVLACRIENQLPDTVSWRRILPFNLRRNPRGPTYHLTLACHHCEDPPCARGCPSGALEKQPDGMVLLYEDRCLGCRYCEMACPFGAPAYDAARALMTKCHLCAPRQERGREPACVEACPTRALRFDSGEGEVESHFLAPDRIPGFTDPDGVGPNLKMAPPREGVRGERYGDLVEQLKEKGEAHG